MHHVGCVRGLILEGSQPSYSRHSGLVLNVLSQEIGCCARLYSAPSLLWMRNKAYQGELGSPTVSVSVSTVLLRDRSRDQLGARRAAPT